MEDLKTGYQCLAGPHHDQPKKGAGDDYPAIPQTEVDPAYTEGQLREKLREANKEIARLKSVSPPPQESQEILWKRAMQLSGAQMDPVKWLVENFTITRKAKP